MDKINVNEIVWVKLTEYGKFKLSQRIEEEKERYGESCLIKYKIKNGYWEVQLWEFMKILGPYFMIGFPNLIEKNTIYFENPGDCK